MTTFLTLLSAWAVVGLFWSLNQVDLDPEIEESTGRFWLWAFLSGPVIWVVLGIIWALDYFKVKRK